MHGQWTIFYHFHSAKDNERVRRREKFFIFKSKLCHFIRKRRKNMRSCSSHEWNRMEKKCIECRLRSAMVRHSWHQLNYNELQQTSNIPIENLLRTGRAKSKKLFIFLPLRTHLPISCRRHSLLRNITIFHPQQKEKSTKIPKRAFVSTLTELGIDQSCVCVRLWLCSSQSHGTEKALQKQKNQRRSLQNKINKFNIINFGEVVANVFWILKEQNEKRTKRTCMMMMMAK